MLICCRIIMWIFLLGMLHFSEAHTWLHLKGYRISFSYLKYPHDDICLIWTMVYKFWATQLTCCFWKTKWHILPHGLSPYYSFQLGGLLKNFWNYSSPFFPAIYFLCSQQYVVYLSPQTSGSWQERGLLNIYLRCLRASSLCQLSVTYCPQRASLGQDNWCPAILLI